jgi:hypothetical protein
MPFLRCPNPPRDPVLEVAQLTYACLPPAHEVPRTPLSGRSHLALGNNNNNTFTWSGPSGVLDCTEQRPGGPAVDWCMSMRRLSRCAIEPAEFAGGKKPPRRKRSRLRFWKGDYWPHAYPFALSRQRPVGSLQLCSPFVALGIV